MAIVPFLERLRHAWSNGLTFGGNRDMYNAFGWRKQLTSTDFAQKYWRQDIAKRVVNAPVNALWSDPPNLEGDDTFQQAWQDLLANVPVFYNLQRLDKLAGLGRYAVMVIGYDDGKELDKPVTASPGRKILYLQPYGETSTKVLEFEQNQTNPRFGQPKTYQIDPGKFDPNEETRTISARVGPLRSFNVHHTRILHVAEDALESTVFGHSRLESVYNVLDDIMKVSGGSAETYWMIANRGLHINIDKEMEMDPVDAEELSEEIKEYEHNLRRTIRTRGVEINSLGAEATDPRGVFDVQLSLLASSTGIPKRVLAGSEAGQLASQQDRANWALKIEERITEYGEPVVLLPFIRTLIFAGVLPKPSKLTINWPDAFKMNPLERAQTSAQMARSAANLAKALETQENINQSMAEASEPREEPVGGGGFFGNSRDVSHLIANAPEPKPKPKDPAKSAEPKTIKKPPLMPKRPVIQLLTDEEARSILGFGKHAPIFDDSNDTVSAVGDNKPKDGIGDE